MATPIEPSGSIKFDDQTFLISYFSDIVAHDNSSGVDSYNNTFRINNNTSLPLSQIIAIFNGTADLSQFLKLKTHQYSALIPRVRLYRVDYNKDGILIGNKEYIFDKDYKFEITDILKSPKRNNSGIKRINWRLAGSNPVTAEKQIEVELELYFDSISSFSGGDFDEMKRAWLSAADVYDRTNFSDFDTDTTTKNYWSLLFHPKISEPNETTALARERYNTNFFRIQANVGWEEVEDNVKNQLFPDIDINEEIRKLNYSFFLNLVEHKFNFNEDGSLTLTATYFAQFENALHNYDYNILGPLKKALELMKTTAIGDLYGGGRGFIGAAGGATNPDDIVNTLGLELTEEQRRGLNDSITSLTFSDLEKISEVINDETKLNCLVDSEIVGRSRISVEETGIPTSLNPFADRDAFMTNNSSVLRDKFSIISDSVNDIINVASLREKKSFYLELFSTFISTNKIKTIRITKNSKTQWENWVQGRSSKPSFNANVQYITLPNRGNDSETTLNLESVIPNTGDVTMTAQANKLKTAGVQFNSNEKNISYVSLGDIIEGAFQTVRNGLTGVTNVGRFASTTSNFSRRFNFTTNTRALTELERNNIICGNISNETRILSISDDQTDFDYRSGGRNLLDIPIDLKLFKLFLIENIIKPQKDTYSLFSFIKDVITKLVTGALNGSNLYNSQTEVYADTSLATTIFNLGDGNFRNNPMSILTPAINASLVQNLEFAIRAYYINNINTHSNHYTYFLIYDKRFTDFYPNSDIEKDESLGIYHFTVGEDYGLLKSANFSRIDTPYLKEAKAVGKQTLYLGQFRDRYNVNLTMVGNNIYYPGMMLYLQPSAEAVQTVSITDPEANPSFSQITGIGGYYFVEKVDSTISEEGYETKLDCIWQYAGDEKPPETIDGLTACDFGLSNPASSQLLSLLIKKLQNDAETAAAEAAEAEVIRPSVGVGGGGTSVAIAILRDIFSEE